MDYVMCLILTSRKDRVLLVRKDEAPYKSLYTGIGGIVRAGETPEECAKRMIAFSMGIVNAFGCKHLASVSVPHDRTEMMMTPSTLHWFCMTFPVPSLLPDVNNAGEELRWFPVSEVLNTPVSDESIFASEGDLQYFLNLALKDVESTVPNRKANPVKRMSLDSGSDNKSPHGGGGS